MGLYEWKFMSLFSLTDTSESTSDWIEVFKAHRNEVVPNTAKHL